MNPLVRLSFSLLVLGIWYQAPQPSDARTLLPKQKYAVMFDAGSSGTRCKVYRVTLPGDHHLLQVSDVAQLDVPKPNKAKPGLSSFGENPAGVGPYLLMLIEAAKKVVPESFRAQTPVFVFATAGMRLLPKNQREAVLKAVDQTLSNSSKSPFEFRKENAKVLTGTEEATYGWVTVNFLLGVFSGNGTEDYGTLEIGGASSQNAFDVDNTPYHASTVLHLGGDTYPVYAHSHLGYGGNEVLKTQYGYLAKKDPESCVIQNPCYNSNYNGTVTIGNKSVEMRGDFNEGKCLNLMRKLFFCRRGPLSKCPFKKQPKLKGKFYSFSLFAYAFRATGIVSQDGEKVSLRKLSCVRRSLCQRKLSPEELKNKYFVHYCSHLNYIYAMLKYGYRIDDSFQLFNAMKINGFELNWVLGAMLTKIPGLL